jgi:hypothetical protein
MDNDKLAAGHLADIERVARAMALHVGWQNWDTAVSVCDTQDGSDPDDERDYWRSLACAAVAALGATAEAPKPAGDWIKLVDRLPETDADGIAHVWAVNIGVPGFSGQRRAGKTRYHKTLGWQPESSTGWDWIVTHWMPLPALPLAGNGEGE